MNKEQKNSLIKFGIYASIALLIFFVAVLGIGYWIGSATKEPDNFVKFYIAGKEYEFKSDDNTATRSEDIVTQADADDMLNQFYSLALFGSTDATSSTPESGVNSILNGTSDDWNKPFVVNEDPANVEALKKSFINVELLAKTLDQSIYSYLITVNETSNNPEIMGLLNDAEDNGLVSQNYLDMLGMGEDNPINDVVTVLSSDQTYLNSVLQDMYTYAYLWQESKSRVYDYNLTEELVSASASIVSSFEIDMTKAGPSDDDVKKLKEVTEPQITAAEWNSTLESLSAKDGVLVDPTITDQTLGDGYFQGFDGIKFGTSAGSSISQDYTFADKTWNVEDQGKTTDGDINKAITTDGVYSHNEVLTNANYYIANENDGGSKGEGAIIGGEEGDYNLINGSANVYSYNQLYPYMFRVAKESTSGEIILGNSYYSLFAKHDGDSYTKTDEEIADNYIMNEWFGKSSTSSKEGSVEDMMPLIGEVYIVTSLIQNDSSLTDTATKYWNDKGFYIELSGQGEEDYGTFVPDALLKVE